MIRKRYRIVYCPFSTSDVEAEAEVWATDEDDARRVFEQVEPGVVFKSATEE
jgi:hypothetical protein